jgi:hypothetical protein
VARGSQTFLPLPRYEQPYCFEQLESHTAPKLDNRFVKPNSLTLANYIPVGPAGPGAAGGAAAAGPAGPAGPAGMAG